MKNIVVCLFEESGYSAMPWARNGYLVYCYDIAHPKVTAYSLQNADNNSGLIIKVPWDSTEPGAFQDLLMTHRKEDVAMLFAAPPCTDLAGSGALHYKTKREEDIYFREKAMNNVLQSANVGDYLECPYVIENPVGSISSEWRKPDYVFNPCDYGGYLPIDDEHPLYPSLIPARDAYEKKTCYWTSDNFTIPEKKRVEPLSDYGLMKLGGKSERTKKIRSLSPRGIAQAIYETHGVR